MDSLHWIPFKMLIPTFNEMKEYILYFIDKMSIKPINQK